MDVGTSIFQLCFWRITQRDWPEDVTFVEAKHILLLNVWSRSSSASLVYVVINIYIRQNWCLLSCNIADKLILVFPVTLLCKRKIFQTIQVACNTFYPFVGPCVVAQLWELPDEVEPHCRTLYEGDDISTIHMVPSRESKVAAIWEEIMWKYQKKTFVEVVLPPHMKLVYKKSRSFWRMETLMHSGCLNFIRLLY